MNKSFLKTWVLFLRLTNLLKQVFKGYTSPESIIPNSRSQFYRHVWTSAAERAGASINDAGYGLFEIEFNGNCSRVYNNYTQLDDIISMRVAGNKEITLSLLAKHGLAIPCYASFDLEQIDKAYNFIRRIQSPCVVKPLKDTAAGKGICTGISDKYALYKAAIKASLLSKELLIEEQIVGSNYRLFFLDGEFLDGVLRHPPKIKGDGRSSIKTLIERENLLRTRLGWERAQTLIDLDYDLHKCLKHQGFCLSSILPNDKEIDVKSVINDNNCNENQRATHLICQSIIDDCKTAAKLVGAKVAGIDIITNDPSLPLRKSGGAILEVNTTPGYYYHYQNIDGPFPIADYIFKKLFS